MFGTVQGGPVYHKTESPTGQICELEARSRSYDDQCLPHQLGGPRWICLSSFTLIDKCFHKVRKERSTITYASDILMVEPTLVPNADGIDDRTSPASTRSEEHTDRLQWWTSTDRDLLLGESQATTCNNRSFKGNFPVIAREME